MKLAILQELIQRYHKALKAPGADRLLTVHWETLEHWQQHWNTEADDLSTAWEKALTNSTSRRYWNREGFHPKEAIQTFIQMDPGAVRSAFTTLLDESKPLLLRVSRFRVLLDDLLEQFREIHPKSELNHHGHDDLSMITLYLSLQHPLLYSPFDYPAFAGTLQLLQSPQPADPYDLDRFVKVSKTIYTFLLREGGLLECHTQLRQSNRDYLGESLLMVYDFYQWSYRQKK